MTRKPMPEKGGMTYKQKFEVLCEFIRDTERAVCGESERLNTMYIAEPDDGRAERFLNKMMRNREAFRIARDTARFMENIEAIETID